MESDLESLHLLLSQHLYTFVRTSWQARAHWLWERKSAATRSRNGPFDEYDMPVIHLQDLTYSLLAGVHKLGCVEKIGLR